MLSKYQYQETGIVYEVTMAPYNSASSGIMCFYTVITIH